MKKIGNINNIDKLLSSKLEYITCTVKYNGEVVDTVKFDGELFETLKNVVKFYIDATYKTDKEYWTNVEVDVKVKTSYTVNESFLEECNIQREFKEFPERYFDEYHKKFVLEMIRFIGNEALKFERLPPLGIDTTQNVHFTKEKQIDYNLIMITQEPV